MANEKHDPWALLREVRDEWLRLHGLYANGVAVDEPLLDRIDAALAAHEAAPPSEEEPDVKWHTAMSYGCDCDNEDEHDHFFLSGNVGAVAVFVYPEKARDGAVPWRAALIHAKEDVAPTLDEAKSAAIAAARGM